MEYVSKEYSQHLETLAEHLVTPERYGATLLVSEAVEVEAA